MARRRGIQQQTDRLFHHEANNKKKRVISISTLIHIYIEMNPNAKQHVLVIDPQTEAICQKTTTSCKACQSCHVQHFSELKEKNTQDGLISSCKISKIKCKKYIKNVCDSNKVIF